VRRRKAQPWYYDFRRKLRFEAEARTYVDDLVVRRSGKGRKAVIIYTAAVTIPGFERRKIVIRLLNSIEPRLIGITADGPTESPHRYEPGGDLCMWRPDAADDGRWTSDEGLWALIQYARVHLFREAYWRATGAVEAGVWAGDEAAHGQPKVVESQSEAA